MKENKQVTLSEQEIGSAYAEALKYVSTSHAITSDETRQCMADALREFYDLLEARIESKCRSGGEGLAKMATGSYA